jgi:hypothetical protein
MNSTGEMISAGILPINQMRDYVEPATVIAIRIPIHLLDAAYGMKIVRNLDFMDDVDRPPTPHEVLCAYCMVKGYITNGTGRWDEFRACKDLLKDFTNGRILFVSQPPLTAVLNNDKSIDEVEFLKNRNKKWLNETEKTMLRNEKISDRIAFYKLKEIELELENKSLNSSSSIVNKVPLKPTLFKSKLSSTPIVERNRNNVDDIDEDDGGEMVFGDFESISDNFSKEQYEYESIGDLKSAQSIELIETATKIFIKQKNATIIDKDGFEYIIDDDDEDDDKKNSCSITTDKNSVADNNNNEDRKTREHKRLKHWGKKNKKLRDKNPYGEENGVISYTAYSTNRLRGSGLITTSNINSQVVADKIKRHDPRNAYGVPFVRAVLPHHQQQQQQEQCVQEAKELN